MQFLIAALLTLCCFVVSASGAPSKEACEGLKKERAAAQTAYNKAHADFRAADRAYENAWKNEESIANSLEKNADNIAIWQEIARDADAALAACQQKGAGNACSKEKNDKKAAQEKLAKLEQRRAELQLDLAQAQDWREKKEAELAAAHQAANAAKQALDAAIAAAAECRSSA